MRFGLRLYTSEAKHLVLDYYLQMNDKPWFKERIGKCMGCGKLAFRYAIGYTCGNINVRLLLCDECTRKFFFDIKFRDQLAHKVSIRKQVSL